MIEETLISQLKKHFEKSGFVNSTKLLNECNTRIPEKAIVMHNSYALMVGIEVLGTGDELLNSLKKTKDEMHDLVRRTLLYLENIKGLIVDGYLLLILKHEPDIHTNELIREIELDTKVCRKHIVWPINGETELDRLQFITVLALPDPILTNSTEKQSFELSAEANALISEYTKLKNLDRVLDYIKQGDIDVN